MGNACRKCCGNGGGGSGSHLAVVEDVSPDELNLSQALESDALVAVGDESVGQSAVNHLNFPFTTACDTVRWIKRNYTVIILRGLPGSGKSTIAKVLRHLYPSSVVCSADDYFIDSHGNYSFDRAKLKEAHQACNNAAFVAMETKRTPVIIDNTNVRRWEYIFYIDMAKRFGYTVVIATPKTPWRFDAESLANINSHLCSLQLIESRLKQWEDDTPIYYAWQLDCVSTVNALNVVFELLDCLLPHSPELAKDTRDRLSVCSSKPRLHVTAKYCSRRTQQQAVATIDYKKRRDVQESIGRVSDVKIVGIFVTPRTVGLQVGLDNDENQQQMSLWDNDPASEELKELGAVVASLPSGSRAHATVATAPQVPPVQAGFDLLRVLAEAKLRPEPDSSELALCSEWGFVRGIGDAFHLQLERPINIPGMFAANY